MIIPFSEFQTLEPDAIIEMFVLDASIHGLDILRFHAGTNELKTNIIWQGNSYVRFPVKASGFEYSGTGPAPRPKLQISNYMSSITSVLIGNDDLLGSKITRKRTFKKYLDAANFSNGENPSADPESYFSDEVYYIDKKTLESRSVVEFELSSALDLQGVMIPRRQIIQNCCCWKYRGTECGYSGTNYFTSLDISTSSQSQDVCGKKLSSCKIRFGESSELPFGGFPGADLFGS